MIKWLPLMVLASIYHKETKMVSEEKLKHYSINFLKSEIDKIHEALEVIQDAEDRDEFDKLLQKLGIAKPEGKAP